MNKSSLRIEEDLLDYIKTSTLVTDENGINGKVYRGDTRPDGSSAEDVVIKYLSGTNPLYGPEDFQDGVLVVNIYCKDKTVKGYKRKLADTGRLKYLAELLEEYVTSHYDKEYQWKVEETPVILEADEIGQHFANCRVHYSRPISIND